MATIVNDQKFLYMGDPTTQLAYPHGYAMIDSINGETGGQRWRRSADARRSSLKALSRVTVSGTVRNAGEPDRFDVQRRRCSCA